MQLPERFWQKVQHNSESGCWEWELHIIATNPQSLSHGAVRQAEQETK